MSIIIAGAMALTCVGLNVAHERVNVIDWKFVNWGSVADWVSGIGSLSAALVALHVAQLSRRIELDCYCGLRILVGGGGPKQELFSITVTNRSPRPTKITNIGFTCGVWRWKRHGLITFIKNHITEGIPKSLSDGEQAHFAVALDESRSWILDLVQKFEMSTLDVKTFRIHVYTSNGGQMMMKPEKPFLDVMYTAARREKHGK